jgi:hypothetical protein
MLVDLRTLFRTKLRTSKGPHSDLKIALVSDDLTRNCLSSEAQVCNVTPRNFRFVLRYWKPNLLFVESAWEGHRGTWKYKIASYPNYPERTNDALQRVVSCARDLGIPTIFWNKEDGVHFERFIRSAALFDHIFTVDENCVPLYRSRVDPSVSVGTLMFAIQPAIHYVTPDQRRLAAANFVGSYGLHVHDNRRAWQDMLFRAATRASLPLTVFDRNSNRASPNYRFPEMPGMRICPQVPHAKTADIYREYLVSLNVNTVEDSPTMYSRRLVEIIACGGIAVTNPTPSVERHFGDYCYAVRSEDEAAELLARLKHGPTREDLERAAAGAAYVLANHTWRHRLEQVMQVIS